MYSVFSNFLEPIGVKCGEETKSSEIYNQLRIAYNQGLVGILESHRLVTLQEFEDEIYWIIEEIWSNKNLHDIIIWINKKITLAIGIVDYRTIDVRLRIAINMINKLELSESISHELGLIISNNLITNVRKELSLINTEDLPF